jgi:hypothetical protein
MMGCRQSERNMLLLTQVPRTDGPGNLLRRDGADSIATCVPWTIFHNLVPGSAFVKDVAPLWVVACPTDPYTLTRNTRSRDFTGRKRV